MIEALALAIRVGDLALVGSAAAGLGLAIGARSMTKRCVGLAIAHLAVAGLFVSAAGAGAPVAPVAGAQPVSAAAPDPLPQAWAVAAAMTALSTLALGLALAVRLREAYGAHRIDDVDARDDVEDRAARED